jgi:hypothetical protein
MRRSPNTLLGRWIGTLILGVLLATSGCGDSSTASVYGSVSYKGQNLKGGRVTFINDKKETFPAEIEENGKYSILKIPSGDYKVCVETEYLKPTPEMARIAKTRPADAPGSEFASQAKRYMAIPATYSNPEQTSLKYTVTGGKQEYNITMN